MTLRSLFEVAAPAKVNLFLHVVGRRADGYHLLQSVFVLIDWCDTLHFDVRRDGRLARHDLGAALPADDLCLRAARALQTDSGTPLGADISIDKRVPWGAGLGGGSSDAASTLLALNRLWRLNWPRGRLLTLALRIGADVPFFVGGQNAFVEGIGEKITPIAVPPQRLAVVKPAAAIDTRVIFASPLLERKSTPVTIEGFGGDVMRFTASARNDLQRAAEAECAEVLDAAAWLEARFGNSRMTGSGSAVFARVDAAGSTQWDAAPAMSGLPERWSGRMCRTLAAHPLAGWATASPRDEVVE